jgi:hypothetical protein
MGTETKYVVTTGYPVCARTITPHATNDLTDFDGNAVPMSVRAESAGTIAVVPAGNATGNSVTFTLAAGEFVPCRCRRVLIVGTTVGSIIGIW